MFQHSFRDSYKMNYNTDDNIMCLFMEILGDTLLTGIQVVSKLYCEAFKRHCCNKKTRSMNPNKE